MECGMLVQSIHSSLSLKSSAELVTRRQKKEEKRTRYFRHAGGQNVVSPTLSCAVELARVELGCEVGSKLTKML